MKRFPKGFMVILMLCMAGAGGAHDAFAQEEGLLSQLDIEASGSLDFYSRYVWRGFTLDRDPVLQPSLSLGTQGFTFTFWSSWDTDNNDGVNSDEIDYVLDYTKEFKALRLSLGHTYYDFPGTQGSSKELYLGLGFEKLPFFGLPISSSLTYYYDYGDPNKGGGLGHYLELALGYSAVLAEDLGISLDLALSAGYNNGLFLAGQGGQVTLAAGISMPLTESLTMSPKIHYTIPFEGLASASDGNQADVFWGGFSLIYSF